MPAAYITDEKEKERRKGITPPSISPVGLNATVADLPFDYGGRKIPDYYPNQRIPSTNRSIKENILIPSQVQGQNGLLQRDIIPFDYGRPVTKEQPVKTDLSGVIPPQPQDQQQSVIGQAAISPTINPPAPNVQPTRGGGGRSPLNVYGTPLQPGGLLGSYKPQGGIEYSPWNKSPTLESLAYALPAEQFRELSAKAIGSYDKDGRFQSLGGYNPSYTPEARNERRQRSLLSASGGGAGSTAKAKAVKTAPYKPAFKDNELNELVKPGTSPEVLATLRTNLPYQVWLEVQRDYLAADERSKLEILDQVSRNISGSQAVYEQMPETLKSLIER